MSGNSYVRHDSESLTGIINTYYPGRARVAAGATSIIDIGPRTGSTTVLAAGNLALVIQMQDAAFNRTND